MRRLVRTCRPVSASGVCDPPPGGTRPTIQTITRGPHDAPISLGGVALVAVLALILTSFAASPATAASKRTKGKVSYGNTTWAAGTSGYAIKGKASGPKRRRSPCRSSGPTAGTPSTRRAPSARASTRSPAPSTGTAPTSCASWCRGRSASAPSRSRPRSSPSPCPWTPRGATSSYLPFSRPGPHLPVEPLRDDQVPHQPRPRRRGRGPDHPAGDGARSSGPPASTRSTSAPRPPSRSAATATRGAPTSSSRGRTRTSTPPSSAPSASAAPAGPRSPSSRGAGSRPGGSPSPA